MIFGLVCSSTKIILLPADGEDLEQAYGTEYNYKCIRYTYDQDDSTDFHKIFVAQESHGTSLIDIPLIMHMQTQKT